jgi:hypothetical protein
LQLFAVLFSMMNLPVLNSAMFFEEENEKERMKE